MDHLQKSAQEAQPHGQLAASVMDVSLAIANASDSQTRSALLLQWYLAARVGDVANLHLDDIHLDPSTRHVKVTIRRGKVIAKRGPYTVNTYLPADHFELLAGYLQARTAHLLQFPQPHPTVFVYPVTHLAALMRQALRDSSPSASSPMTTRGIRRGSLQNMAINHVPIETLLTFSGHTNVNMLKRYLDWGRLLGVEETNAQAAARFLAPQTVAPTASF